jgi:aminomethyltransferase
LLLNTLATLVSMAVSTLHAASRPRAYVSVTGQDAASYLNRMVSNEVESLPVGESCEALLLTPKARIVSPLVVWRRADDDYLLLTEPEAGGPLLQALLRARLAARCAIEPEEHRSVVVLGGADELVVNHHKLVPNHDYGVPAVELVDTDPPDGAAPIGAEELERLRILARTPRLGRELDDRVMPAEAGLEARAISFTKGCYPGQEPVARLHFRGHPNRGLRALALDGDELPAYDAELTLAGKAVGRVTSAAADPGHGVVALAFVRREVPPDAELDLSGRRVRQLSA